MFPGSYSQRFKTMEKEHVEHLKVVKQTSRGDTITRSRRLSLETNKRRKAQALKRRNELIREEKRRQDILAHRREEQQRATDQFQRAFFPGSRPGSQRTSPTRMTSTLDDALKLIRGSLSRQSSSHSSLGSLRGKHSPRSSTSNIHNPRHHSYFKRQSSRHLKHQPSPCKAQKHADLLNSSLQNFVDSRSLFEQQLERHQQILLEDQQKSLNNFNQAIKKEIDADSKLEGTEEGLFEDGELYHSDSLSSLDSLDVSRDNRPSDRDTSHKDDDTTATTTAPIVGRVIPNSAHSRTFNNQSVEEMAKPFHVEYYHKSQTTNYERGPIIGPIINTGRSKVPFVLNPQRSDTLYQTIKDAQTSFITELSQPQQAEGTMFPLTKQAPTASPHVIQIISASEIHTSKQTSVLPLSFTNPTATNPSYSSISHINQKLPPTTTAVNTEPASPVPSYSTSTFIFPVSAPTPASVLIPNTHTVSHKKPPVVPMSVPRPLTAAPLVKQKLDPPAKTQSVDVKSERSVHQNVTVTSANSTTHVPTEQIIDGSIVDGTLGLVGGKLSVLSELEAADNEAKKRIKKSASQVDIREVRSILKWSEPTPSIRKYASDPAAYIGKLSATGIVPKKAVLNVKDSIDLARQNKFAKKNGSGKKSVRFVDLQYEEDIPEDTDSIDSNSDSAPPVRNSSFQQNNRQIPRPRPRPVSAKLAGSRRVDPKLNRSVSAGYIRTDNLNQHAQDRPKAAAHIIAHSIEGNDQLGGNHDTKVAVVTNNFVGKPAVITTRMGKANLQGVIHTVNNVDINDSPVLQRADVMPGRHVVSAPVTSYRSPEKISEVRKGQEVYNENGMRIDRTPTDDEINWLWDKVRTCLNRDVKDGDKKMSSGDQSANVNRQAAPVSNKYIDGSSIGLTNGNRVNKVIYGNGVQQRAMSATTRKSGANGYMRKYGLLQQRKQVTETAKNAQNYVGYSPTISNSDPQESERKNVPRADVEESLAMFLAAEHFADRSMSDSQIQLALEEARRRRAEINAAKNRGVLGPSALSLEEQKLLESLDQLNEKLKISEEKQVYLQTNQTVIPSPSVRNLHTGSFRGRPPISQPFQYRSRQVQNIGMKILQATRLYR